LGQSCDELREKNPGQQPALSQDFTATTATTDKATTEETRRWLESLPDEDLGPYKM